MTRRSLVTPSLSSSGRVRTRTRGASVKPVAARPMTSTLRRDPGFSRTFVTEGIQMFTYGHAEAKGLRPTMEDSCTSCGEFAGSSSQYYGLFDGHGGNQVAMYCAANLHHGIEREIRAGTDVRAAMKSVIRATHKFAIGQWLWAGTTAALACIIDNVLYTANVGDSRVILMDTMGRARRLTVDHKATAASERRMILKRGGSVIQGRVNGILMLSRAIGDAEVARYISCEAYTTETPLTPDMKLILACDGVWDVMSDQQAADIFTRARDPKGAAESIKSEALKRGSTDNVSVICVDLHRAV